ncbi:MAG: PilZ domain-containing protein [Permianibacter sp.]
MTTDDKRESQRWARRERAYIQLLFDDGGAVRVQTEDISAGGFRAALAAPLPEGSILHVVIELSSSQSRYLLAAEVRWCRELTAGHYHVGFSLLDARGTDYEAWQQFAGNPDGLL